MQNIGIIGTGIFGSALALTAVRAGNKVLCWDRKQDIIDSINQKHTNQRYLPNIPLGSDICATNDLAEIFETAKIVLLTTSAQATREILEKIKHLIKADNILVFCDKGIEEQSGKMLSEIAQEIIPSTTIAILSGPGFAVDIAHKKLASVTIASQKEGIAKLLCETLGTPFFRPYTTTDIISPQIGGSVKNVIAIASGVIEGAGLGDSARAALITRGLHEMGVLSRALHGLPETMMGMSGLGDLVLTANCTQSRNFSFGYQIGLSGNAKKAMAENTRTVEGIATAQAVMKRARSLNVEMPISEIVNQVLFADMPINEAMQKLLHRPYKEEGF